MHDRRSSRPVITGVHKLTDDRFQRPVIDDGGLLWFGDRWVVVTEMQAPVVELLLTNLGRTVSRELIAETYGAAGGSTREAAVISLMRRLARQFTSIGAKVRFAYQSGAMVVSWPPSAPVLG